MGERVPSFLIEISPTRRGVITRKENCWLYQRAEWFNISNVFSIREGLQMLKKYNKMNDITKILIAMLLGSLLGILLGKRLPALVLFGTIWLNLMKMFLVPIVICMMVKGITSMDNPKTLEESVSESWSFICLPQWRLRSLGLVITEVFHPGVGSVYRRQCGGCRDSGASAVGKFFTDMFSSNIFCNI